MQIEPPIKTIPVLQEFLLLNGSWGGRSDSPPLLTTWAPSGRSFNLVGFGFLIWIMNEAPGQIPCNYDMW